MTHHLVSTPEPDGAFILRCSCGWAQLTHDHRASIAAARKHKEKETENETP